MTLEQFVVLTLVFLPFLGAIIVASLGPSRTTLVRGITFAVSVIMLGLALFLAVQFMAMERSFERPADEHSVQSFVPEFVPGSTSAEPHATTWDFLQFDVGNVQFFLGVDGLNIWLIVLTAVLFMPSVLVSFSHIDKRTNEFYAWLMGLQFCLMGVFFAFDIILFYIFFELSLVPLFFLIGIWGGSQRQYAARKFVIYTLAGSLITLLGILGVIIACGVNQQELSFSIPTLVDIVHSQLAENPDQSQALQLWIFFALSLGLAVKVPLIPFHTWLPLAHVEAPTAGSVDLAGVLLKIGSYAFLRLCIPLAPDVSLTVGLPVITILAAIGIIYGALCAFAQSDIKRLIAYSSVSHLGLCMLGMFALNPVGLQGSLLQMINHGLSTGALFLMIGMLYDRYHTREIKKYGGMASKMPILGLMFVFFTMSSIGLPGLNGFISEFLCLAGIALHELYPVYHFPILTIIGSTGIILGAWYMITLVQKVFFGPVKEPLHGDTEVKDLSFREWGLLVPIAALCLLLGVYPMPVLETSAPDVARISLVIERAEQRAESSNTVASVASLTPETQETP